MTAFKLFFKIMRSKRTSVILYACIFLFISTLSYLNTKSDEQFVISKHRILLYDNDNSELSRGMCEYLGKNCEIKTLPDSAADESSQKKLMYYTTIHEAVYINEGFSEEVFDMTQNPENLVTIKSVHNTDELLKVHTNNFINAVRGYLLAGKSESESVSLAMDALSDTADVKIADFDSSSGNKIGQYYGMLPYAAISIIISALTPILYAIYRKDIFFRTSCSCVKQTRFTMEITLAGFILVMFFWGIFMAAGIIFNGGIHKGREAWVFANSFVLFLMSTCLSIFISTLIKNVRVVDFLTQILGLGMCFLCGVFVPLNYLSGGVVAFAKFLPVYWYTKANNIIFNEAFDLSKLLSCIGVQFLFAAVFIVCTLAIKHNKRALEA